MPDNLSKKRPQDAKRINLSEPYEIEYWTKEFGCTENDLRRAVRQVGDSVEAVRRYLQSH